MSNEKFTIKKFTIKNSTTDASPQKRHEDLEPETRDFNDLPPSEKATYYTIGDFSLSSIIREISSPTDIKLINGAVQKIVKLNPLTGRIVSENISQTLIGQINRFFNQNTPSLRYFLVNTSQRYSTPILSYQIRIGEQTLVLNVKTEISRCLNPKTLVEKLAVMDNLASSFDSKMKEWLEERLLNEREDPVLNFFGIRDKLQRAIENKLIELGLNSKVSIKLKNEHIAKKSFEIEKNEPFEVQLDGLSELFKIKYRATISVRHTYKVYSILKYDELPELPKRIASYLSACMRNYKFSDFVDGLSSAVKEEITAALNEKMTASREGWKIDVLVIEIPNDKFQLVKHLEISEEPTKVTIKTEQSQGVPVKVLNSMVLNLLDSNLARTAWKQTKNLEQWAKDTLKEVTCNTLINASYADLIINQKELETEIKDLLSDKALEIGYRINSFFTIPDVEHIKLGEPFNFKTDEDIEFDTKIGDKVKIQISVQNARIIDFNKIRNYLTPDRDIVGEMKRVIIEKVGLQLQQTDPDDYYSKFELSLREELSLLIQKVLTETFSLDESAEIGLRQIKTDLIHRLEKLCQGFTDFEFKSFGSLHFKTSFSVKSIDPNGGWIKFKHNNFENKKSEIDAIKQRLISFIESALNDEFSIAFKNVQNPDFNKIVNSILKKSENHIKETFGLMIEVFTPKREMTSEEKAMKYTQGELMKMKVMGIDTTIELAKRKYSNFLNRHHKLQRELLNAEEEEDSVKIDRITAEIEKIEYGIKLLGASEDTPKLEAGQEDNTDLLDERTPQE